MTMRIDCETVQQHRDEYLRGRGPVDLVDAHLADCPTCLDGLIDETLATPADVAPPWGFATRVVANLPPEPSARPRPFVLVISALVGIVLAGLAMILGDTTANLKNLTTPHTLGLEAAVVAECILLFWFLTRRRGVFTD